MPTSVFLYSGLRLYVITLALQRRCITRVNTYYALGLVNLAAHLFTFSYHRVVPSNFKDRFQYKICNDDCGCIALVAKNNFGHSRHQYQPDRALMLCSRIVNTFASRRGFYQWLVVQLAGGQLAPL